MTAKAILAVPALESKTPVQAPPSIIQLCTHIMATGAACGSPAVRGTELCFHHSAVKTALGRVTPIEQVPYGVFSPIPFVFAEDAASLQINYQLLLQAVSEKRAEPRAGALMFRILHAMADNLKNPLIAESPATHGEGDKINNLVEQPEAPSPRPVYEPENKEPERENSAQTSSESSSSSRAAAPTKKVRVEDHPALKAAIEATHSDTRLYINHHIDRDGCLGDEILQYFSLPPYDKPENKPEPWMPAPLNPSVQRVIALSCDRP